MSSCDAFVRVITTVCALWWSHTAPPLISPIDLHTKSSDILGPLVHARYIISKNWYQSCKFPFVNHPEFEWWFSPLLGQGSLTELALWYRDDCLKQCCKAPLIILIYTLSVLQLAFFDVQVIKLVQTNEKVTEKEVTSAHLWNFPWVWRNYCGCKVHKSNGVQPGPD